MIPGKENEIGGGWCPAGGHFDAHELAAATVSSQNQPASGSADMNMSVWQLRKSETSLFQSK